MATAEDIDGMERSVREIMIDMELRVAFFI